jgi:hypothetical protein
MVFSTNWIELRELNLQVVDHGVNSGNMRDGFKGTLALGPGADGIREGNNALCNKDTLVLLAAQSTQTKEGFMDWAKRSRMLSWKGEWGKSWRGDLGEALGNLKEATLECQALFQTRHDEVNRTLRVHS